MDFGFDTLVAGGLPATVCPPAPTPASITPNQLRTWVQCPLNHRLRYVDGVVPPTAPSAFLGTVVRDALTYLYQAERDRVCLGPAELCHYVMEQWETLAAREAVVFVSVREEQAHQQQAFAPWKHTWTVATWDEPPTLAVAQSITAPLLHPATGQHLGVDLVGTLDLILDDPAGPLLVDFRTSSRSRVECRSVGGNPSCLSGLSVSAHGWLSGRRPGDETAGEDEDTPAPVSALASTG